jgi:hypothetical protein
MSAESDAAQERKDGIPALLCALTMMFVGK